MLRRRSALHWLAAGAAFLGLSVVLTRHVWAHPGSTWIGAEGDPRLFMWWLAWMPHAIGNGLNPLHPTLVQYPSGTNALWNTSIVVPSLLLAPVTAAAGPIWSYNIIQTLAPVLSALVAMAAIGRFVERRWAAFVGALIYGFSPYMVVKMEGHPNLLITVFPPIALICLHELFLRQRRSHVIVGALFGLAATAQLLTGEELLVDSAIGCALAVVLVALLYRPRVTPALKRGLVGLGVAAGVALVTAAPFLAYQFKGPNRAGCCLPGTETYRLDLQTLVTPSRYQALHTNGTLQAATHWRGFNESNGYIGIPLLIALAAIVFLLRRRREVVVAALGLVSVIVLAVGAHVDYGGKDTGISGPWRVVQHLPLMGDVIPGRLMLLGFLAIAILVGIGLDAALHAERQERRWLLAGGLSLAVVTLVPNTVIPTKDPTPPLPTDQAALQRLIPKNSVAMVSPFYPPDGMLWQAKAHFRFRLMQGTVILPGPSVGGPNIPVVGRTWSIAVQQPGNTTVLTEGDRAEYLKELHERHVTIVLVGDSSGRPALEGFLHDLLGDTGDRSGGITVFRVPS